jgi:predicted MFS family arabinose efflux permease
MRERLRAAAWALRRVAANRDIRRAEAAWMLGWAAEWSWLVALAVFAYGVGGVALVGAMGLVRTLPAAVLAQGLSSLADRWPRHRVLLAVHGGRAVLVAAASIAVLAGWSPALVLSLAALDGLLAVLHRPTHMALMPSLARSPEDLVAANVASGTLEGLGILAGPIAGGLLVATGQPALPFAVPAAVFALAAAMFLGVRPTGVAARAVGRVSGPVATMLSGLRAVRGHPHAALMLGLFGLQTLVRGLLSVLLVVLAIELLRIGEEGVGFLNAAIGAGGLAGAISALALVGRARLAPPVLLGLVLWGLPILLIGLVPGTGVALLALAVLGAGNAVLDIAGFTLLQRLVPNEARGRVFGLLEALVMLTVGVGAALAPLLVELAGTRMALVITGLLLPVAALAAWPWMRSSDRYALVPARELGLLRGVPMLGALPMTAVEELACRMQPRRYAAGEPIVTMGEVGDRFYIVASGSAEVTMPGHATHRLGEGDSFGEIALLRDVRRTATVTALDVVETLAIEREVFVAAVSGDRLSLEAADAQIRERLQHRHEADPASPGTSAARH